MLKTRSIVLRFSRKNPITRIAMSWSLTDGVCQTFAEGFHFFWWLPEIFLCLIFLSKFTDFQVMLYFTLFVNCQFNYVNIVILSTIEHQLKTPLVGCLREKYFRKSFQGQKLRELFGNTKKNSRRNIQYSWYLLSNCRGTYFLNF